MLHNLLFGARRLLSWTGTVTVLGTSNMLETVHRTQRLPQAAASSVEKLCPDGIDVLINMAGVDPVVVLSCPLTFLCLHMSNCCARTQ